jgi:hypothetical protein
MNYLMTYDKMSTYLLVQFFNTLKQKSKGLTRLGILHLIKIYLLKNHSKVIHNY